jgi:hypothetical protein
MLSNKIKALVITIVTIVVLTPIVVSISRATPARAGVPAASSSEKHGPPFVDDPAALGAWSSVDFVQRIEDFTPGKRAWAGGLYLKGIEFKPGGGTSGPWEWSKGTLWHPGDQTLAKYTIKDLGGTKFMFMEWMSGDVTIRGEKPRYYVLAKGDYTAPPAQRATPAVTEAPAFVDDPAVIGSWTSVDFVQSMEAFVPGKKSWQGDLFLKGIQFNPGGETAGPWKWSKGTLWHPGDQTLAKYTIKEMGGTQFLFMEWMSGDVIIRGEKPRYYVLTRVQTSAIAPPQQGVQPTVLPVVQAVAPAPVKVSDSAAVGSWTTVDFVQNYEDFVAGQRAWAGDFYLKGLQFRANGTTSGPWTWGRGALWHPGDKTTSRYAIQNINGRQYLFMEWMSGDVTIRGQKPWIYVMARS